MWLQPAREACGQFPPVPEAWPLGGRPRRSQTTVSHLPFPKGPGDAAQVPLWALAPEEPLPSRVVNVPIHISCTAEAMHPPLDGSLMFLRRRW